MTLTKKQLTEAHKYVNMTSFIYHAPQDIADTLQSLLHILTCDEYILIKKDDYDERIEDIFNAILLAAEPVITE